MSFFKISNITIAEIIVRNAPATTSVKKCAPAIILDKQTINVNTDENIQEKVFHFLLSHCGTKYGKNKSKAVPAAAHECPEGKDLKKSPAYSLIELNLFLFIVNQFV